MKKKTNKKQRFYCSKLFLFKLARRCYFCSLLHATYFDIFTLLICYKNFIKLKTNNKTIWRTFTQFDYPLKEM